MVNSVANGNDFLEALDLDSHDLSDDGKRKKGQAEKTTNKQKHFFNLKQN